MRLADFNGLVAFITAISSIFGLAANTINTSHTPFNLSFVNAVSQNKNPSIVIDKLTATARIITAISVENGLSDGSIPVDSVIAELLNIGSEDFKSLLNFNQTRVSDFLDKLEKVRLSKDSLEVEVGIVNAYDAGRKWKEIKDLDKLPTRDAYKKLDDIKNIDLSKLKGIDFSKVAAAVQKSKMENADITNLKTFLEETNEKVKIVKYSEVLGVLEQLKPLEEVYEVFIALRHLPELDIKATVKSGITNNFDSVKDILSSLDLMAFEVLNNLIQSRVSPHPIDRPHTTGFINGFNDVNKLSGDISNKWIQSNLPNISNTFTDDKLLTELTPGMDKLDTKWKEVSTRNILQSLKQVSEFNKMIDSIKEVPLEDGMGTTFGTAEGCRQALAGNVVPELKSIIDIEKLARKKLSSLQKVQKRFVALEPIIKVLSSQTSAENLAKLKKFVLELEKDLTEVTDGTPINTLKFETNKKWTFLEFDTGSIAKYKTQLNCFNNMGAELENVATIAKSIAKIGEIRKDGEVLRNVKKASDAISQSGESLVSIRKTMNSIKANVGDETKRFRGLMDYSKPFGEAVTALVMADVASKKTAEFESFEKDGNEIEGQVGMENDEEFKKTFKQNWGDFGKTTDEIKKMLDGIQDWIKKIEVSENATFQDLGAPFSSAPNFVDVDLMGESRIDAIESFEKIVKTTATTEQNKLLDKFKESLSELSKMDLKFTRFQKSVDSMKATIGKVVEVLDKVKNEMEEVHLMPEFDIKRNKYNPTTLYVFLGLHGFGCPWLFWVLMCYRSDAKRLREEMEENKKNRKKTSKKSKKKKKKHSRK
ncbi:hypothetical protein GCK72_011769 [Caenorhabditis remanei]|uniref:Domain of unknown function WSN domain-containing protein n=1 Tax=Caenorhabditis remanei TaxID=31234 RepID=A0A6A5HAP2_CAERE|nr:hypothetical protein GCK72_011769 [Caenorhabditis remanei]KAF1763503.1 hypothetical protein GCK72_011769 [Caenorhabditis remanei]